MLRVLHGRLLAAAALTDYKLILECFHPASKNLNPYLYCDYLGTPGLSDTTQGQGLVYHAEENIGRLGKLGGLYSRFRPIRPEEEHRIFVRQPVGDDASGGEGLGGGGGGVAAPQESSSPPPPYSFPSTINDSMGASRSSSGDGGGGLVSHNINLDTDERFSQLCVVTNLIKLGPRRGVFRSFVNVSEGLVRVMRDWLGKRAHALGAEDGETRTLWLDAQENVGIRVRVTERSWRRAAPVLLHRDEDPAVSYLVEYEGERSMLLAVAGWAWTETDSLQNCV